MHEWFISTIPCISRTHKQTNFLNKASQYEPILHKNIKYIY